MKKVIIVLTALLFALHMQAQDNALLDQIKTVNGKITSFEADLSNTLAKSDEKRVQNGTLHYVKPHEFAAQFNTGKYMIVNEKRIKMDIGIFHGTFRLKDGGNMQALANIFLDNMEKQRGIVIATVSAAERGPDGVHPYL